MITNNQVELGNLGDQTSPQRQISSDIFDYPYENILPKGNYQQKYQTKSRKITSNREDSTLPDNSIRTAKYTLMNFLPKQLFLQLSKLSNLYFLVIGIMQIIPQVSISNSVPVIFLPLSVIMLVSAVKDLYEDYKRQTSDKEENNRKVLVLEGNEFVERAWKDLRVGNVIKLFQDNTLPADILLLKSSENKGVCYIETKSLDGETNLKMKNVSSDLLKEFQTEVDVIGNRKKIILKYEAPNPYLYRFYGEVIDRQGSNHAINFNNFILRGCTLRNVKFIIGLVAYSGHDTKIMLNSFKARSKKSKLEILMQNQIFYIFIIQMIICCFAATYYLIWYNLSKKHLQYLNIDLSGTVDNSPVYNWFVRFGNWVLIFTQKYRSNFVPISLLVTLEMVKFVQGMQIGLDPLMDGPVVQSSNLNEELGQIEYVFSDKTGTLTSNVMEFKQITIGSVSYGDVKDGDKNYIADISGFPKVTNVDFRDQQIFDDLKNPNTQKQVLDCLMFLATCHTVITDQKDDQLVYNASSPDELALINFAKFCGVEYLGTDENNIISVKYGQEQHEYQLIEIFEFTSGRKRQSVVVKSIKDNETWLLTKGADSVLLDQIRLSKSEQLQRTKFNTMVANLKKYGEVGLRTLVLCRRKLEGTQFEEWRTKYSLASMQLEGRAEKMQVLQDELENEFEVVGSTAIEDKLQVDVGSTIEAIKNAGIKVWVLTGDKIETAINIGYSCKLLNNSMKQHLIDEKEERMIRNALDETLLEMQPSSHPTKGVVQNAGPNGFQALMGGGSLTNIGTNRFDQQHALIISGDSLFHALKPNISNKVMEIAEQCQVVLCCRVSPKQKQDVVALVRKEKPTVSTLAIGDGANDVNMIRAAHVGIGIRGVEGQQAARASDYAVSEFRQLRRLLFYHGRESYRRNSCLVCYNFFKNIMLVLPQFWYGALSIFSAQSLYDAFLYQLYNLLYASMPIIIYAVFDQEYDPEILVENKSNYYAQGLHNLLFNSKVFWLWVINGIWQAAILCYFPFYLAGDNFISQDGFTQHLWADGTMVYGLVVLISNFKILIFSNTFTIASFIAITGSLLSYLFSWLIVDSISDAEAYQVFLQLWKTPNFHLGNILSIGATTFIDLGIHFYIRWSSVPVHQTLSRSDDQAKRTSSANPNFMMVSKSVVARGRVQRNPTNHTGFAFCALEKEPNLRHKDHKF